MAAIDCIKKVLEKIPGATPDDVENLYNSMSKMRQDAFANGLMNPDSEFRVKAEAALRGYVEMVQRLEAQALENVAKRAKVERMIREDMGGDTFKGLKGTAVVMENRQLAVREMMQRSLLMGLDEAKNPGITKIYTSGILDQEVFRAVHDLSYGKEIPKVSKEAEIIARAIVDFNKVDLRVKNGSGAFVKEAEGRVMKMQYDPEKIKALGDTTDEQFEAFKELMLENLDHERTFNSDFFRADPEKFLKEAFEKIMLEKNDIGGSNVADQFVKIIGTPADMAKKAQAGRSFFYKDGDAMFRVNEAIGRKTLAEQVNATINATSRNAGMMQILGTNPKATWQRLSRGLEVGELDSLERRMRELDGTTANPGQSAKAEYGRNIRAVMDMTKLGFSLPSHFGMFTTRASALKVNGVGFLEAHLNAFDTFIKSVPAANRLDVVRLIGIGADQHLGALYHELTGSVGATGKIAKASEMFFKLNGMTPFIKASQSGTAMMLSADLGNNAGRMFAQLEPGMARTLNRYGIGPVEWDVARSVATDSEYGKLVGYGDIEKLPNELVASIMQKGGMKATPRAIEQMKFDTQMKLASYFKDRIDTVMGKPGVNERADFLRRGTSADTWSGQAMRFLAMYKAYPVAMANRYADMIGSEILAHQTNFEKVGTITTMAASSIALGYLGLVVKEAAKNKTPPPPNEAKTWMEAAVKGGALGLYGDYILGEYDQRRGRSMGSAMLGPLFGQIDDLNEIKNAALDPEKPGGKSRVDKVMAQVFRVTKNNLPGPWNFPILKPAMDQLFLNSLSETMNPGYLERQRTRMHEAGQDSIFGQ